jgi:hypothetical protein
MAAAALGALALFASSTLAADSARAGLYRGALEGSRSNITISFRVSAGMVEGLAVSSLPLYCPGTGPPGTPTIVFANARISPGGRFAAAGKDMISSGRLKGAVAATLKVSGTFASDGSEHGTVTTDYGGGAATACGGHSAYKTRHA